MSNLLSSVLPLAFGAAVSPTILTATVLILTSKSHPRGRAGVFAVGAGLLIVAVGIVGLVVFRNTVASAAHKPSVASAIISLAFGVLLILLSIRIFAKGPIANKSRPSESEPAATEQPLKPGRYFAFGLTMMATNFTTLVLYFPLIKEITRSHVSAASEVLTLLFCDLIIMVPVLVPLVIVLLMPGRSTAILARLHRFFTAHAKTVGGGLAAVFGVYLAIKGIGGL